MGQAIAQLHHFLISTPESGVDSIAMTYGMMDLPMTIIRPVSAFISAFIAGILQMFFNPDTDEEIVEEKKSCCSKNKNTPKEESFASKVSRTFNFAFFELVDDFAKWLAIGIVAGALIDFLVPPNFFEGLGGWTGRFAILAVGIPLYICASATTPIAASLVMKGMSPGTSLLILLVGPATNISNIFVISQYIGKKGVFINIVAIALSALGLSFLVDYLYGLYSWPIDFKVSTHAHEHAGWWEIALAIVFSALIIKSLIKVEVPKIIAKFKKKEKPSGGCCSKKS